MEQDDWYLLKRYYRGAGDATEGVRAKAILETAIERPMFLELLEELAREPQALTVPDSAEAYSRFAQSVIEGDHASTAIPSSTSIRGTDVPIRTMRRHGFFGRQRLPTNGAQEKLRLPRLIGMAPMLVIAAIAGGVVWRAPWRTVAVVPAPMRQIATAPGERAKLTLPDGSTMTLGPQSSVRFPKAFGDESRVVELEGQAVFTVANEGQPPFIVRTPRTETRVLGTTFFVRHYASDTAARIVVAEGKVDVRSNGLSTTAVLTAGEVAVVANTVGIVTERGADLGRELGWTQGQLHFRGARLRDALRDINRVFAFDIRLIASALGDRHVTITVDQSMGAPVIASLLAEISGAQVRQQGSTFFFTE